MNDEKNPCYIAVPTSMNNRCEMTVYETPLMGRLAIPTHLLNSIHCPDASTLLVSYSSVALKVTGRNLGEIFDLLVERRLKQVVAVDELGYPFTPGQAYVRTVEVLPKE